MNAVGAAIYSKLTGDATLTAMLAASTAVYEDQAYQDASYPMVVFNKPSGLHVHAMAARVAFNELFVVKAVTQCPATAPDKDPATDIDDRIDALLNNGTLTISGHTQLACFRESDVDYPENADGLVYFHVGGIYRIWSV